MPNISLAEAVKLKSVLTKRIHELDEELNRVAFVEIVKGTKPPKQVRKLEDVERDMESIRTDLRLIDKLMYRANIDNEIIFNDEKLSIVEAIELAIQLRAKAKKYKELGSAVKEEYSYSYSETAPLMKMAMFDPEEYRVKGIECERQANRLSNLVNSKNYSIQLSFDSSSYF